MTKINKSTIAKLIISLPFIYFFFYKDILPFHFQWDTDATVTIDTLLINSGLLPAHINHPSYGMYWLQSIISNVAGLITINFKYAHDLNSLIACDNMMKCIANHAGLLQFLSKIVVGLTISTLLLIIWRAAKSIPVVIIACLILIFDEGLIYNSVIIKSEVYAFFFFIISLYFLQSAHENSRLKSVYFLQPANENSPLKYIFLAGIFAGLAYFTKIQYVLYIVSLFFLVPFIDTRKSKSTLNNLYLAALLIYFLVLVLTAKYGLPPHVFEDTANLNFFNRISIIFWVLLFTQLGFNIYLQRTSIQPNFYIGAGRNLIFFFNGFCASLLLPLFTNGPIFGTKLSSQAYAMGLARDLTDKARDPYDSWSTFLPPWHDLAYLLVAVAIVSFLIITIRTNKKVINIAIFLPIFFIAIVNLLFILRPTYRDLFPAKTLLLTVSLIYSAYAIRILCAEKKYILHRSLLLLLAILVPIQYYHSEGTIAYVNAENTHYGYNAALFTTGYYGGNHTKFYGVTKDKVGINWHLAKGFRKNKKVFKTVLPNLKDSCFNNRKSHNDYDFPAVPEVQAILDKSKKFKYVVLTAGCENNPLIQSKWTYYGKNAGGYITNDFWILNDDNKKAIEILPRPDLNFILISNHPIRMEHSKHYLKAGAVPDNEWKEFVDNSNFLYRGTQISAEKNDSAYIYKINRYTRIYLDKNDVAYLGYAEHF